MLIVLVLAGGVVGMMAGLIRTVFGALGAVLAILLAGQLRENVGGLYSGAIGNETLANLIAYALIITVPVLVARVLAIVVRKAVYMLFMG